MYLWRFVMIGWASLRQLVMPDGQADCQGNLGMRMIDCMFLRRRHFAGGKDFTTHCPFGGTVSQNQ